MLTSLPRCTSQQRWRTWRRNYSSNNMSTSEIYSPGLEGVIAGETAISTVTGGLRYRGYPVTELAEKRSFEDVAFLLLHGEWPTASQLKEFQARLATVQKLPKTVSDLLKAL